MKRILKFIAFRSLCAVPFFALCIALCGCPAQNTAAALIGIAGTAVASLEAIDGHADLVAQIQKDFGDAQTAVLNWTPGSPTQDAHQALAIVVNDLGDLPVTVQTQAYIDLAIATVQAVLDLFPGTAPQFATTAKVRRVQIVAPKNAAEFKASWNALPGHLAQLK